MKHYVSIYTDGACGGNPGPGGWAAILVSGQHRKEISGGQYIATTNNEMEMQAVFEGLLAIKVEHAIVTIYTDSQNVIGWMCQGWKCEKNPNIVRTRNNIRALCNEMGHNVSYVKVDGHNGDPLNELADALAKAAIEKAVADHRRECRLRPSHPV